MDKFKNIYRIPSARLQSWDYGANGAYFITICTQKREHFFGEIANNEMQLNELGQLAEKYWIEIPNHFPFIELGNFVVMPNHTHGILIIDNNPNDNMANGNMANGNMANDNVANDNVETRLIASLPPTEIPPTNKTGGFAGNKNPMFHQNISRIIRWYKGRCSFEFRKIHADFAWQSRFHDHIIRNLESFETIQNYIANNPMNWGKDKFYNNNG
jgi:REP element-mobilizing transposase RayT